MSFNCFEVTNADDWCIKAAYNNLEKEHPRLSPRELLAILKERLREYIKVDSVDVKKAAAALKILQHWRVSRNRQIFN
jgi:hypothetical protein